MELDSDDVGKPDDLIGRAVGKYEIVRLVGKGGMGRAYEAINPTIGKRVVIKMLDPEVAKNREAVARFQREAQAASAAESPHIVEIFDSGFADDRSPFIVMELLRGETLSSLLRREGKLTPEETTRILVQVLRGLSKAHAAGIVHRDLKPDNIFLVDRDPDPSFAKVLDFGVSKIERTQTTTTLTREGTVLGTPCYMSPEQAQGESDVDARSDIWSVGAILFECLTGRPPFEGATYEQIIVRICTTDPKPIADQAPDTPKHLVEAVAACLQRERKDRVASAAELLTWLGEPASSQPRKRPNSLPPSVAATPKLATDSTIEAPGVLVGERLRRGTSSSRARYALPLGIAALVGSGALVAFTMSSRPIEQQDPRPTAPPPSAPPTTTLTTTEPTAPSVLPATATPTQAATTEPTAVASTEATAQPRSTRPGGGGRPRPPQTATVAATPPPQPPPIPPPTSSPKGVAGDLTIQPK